jgi:Ala-tRNA(Pro) deacylase
MNKQEIYAFLSENNIEYEITEHEAVYNMEEVSHIDLPYPGDDAKNLFVRDDKKRNYYLITVRGNKRVDLKDFKRKNGTRTLSFASAEDLMDKLALIPGAVTPLGLLNDADCAVHFCLDREFLTGSGRIGVHPNDNTATVWLQAADLVHLIEAHGNTIQILEI